MQKSHPSLKDLRRERCLTLEELSRRCGIPVSTLGHIENGTRKASAENIELLSAALDFPPVELQDIVEFRGYTHRVHEVRETGGQPRPDVLRYLSVDELRNILPAASQAQDWSVVAAIGAELALRGAISETKKFTYPKKEGSLKS